ncbi:MAG: 3-oxoacyl-ACP synthase [Sphingobacteriaceae bacterium]
MTSKQALKIQILEQLKLALAQKIAESENAIASAKESRDSESKSSAGDKYETGRAMMQIELQNQEIQLNKALQLKNELHLINLQQAYEKAVLGSLVLTNREHYFISIGLGKIEVDGHPYYAISLASPIGMLLKDQQAGQTISFQGREITIREIH